MPAATGPLKSTHTSGGVLARMCGGTTHRYRAPHTVSIPIHQ